MSLLQDLTKQVGDAGQLLNTVATIGNAVQGNIQPQQSPTVAKAVQTLPAVAPAPAGPQLSTKTLLIVGGAVVGLVLLVVLMKK